MKTTKLLFIALAFAAMAASSAVAQTVRNRSVRPSIASSRTVTASHWNHHRYYRPRSSVYFGFGLGYPDYGYGWGYPYYGAYPYGYGYYTPRYTTYDRGITDDATVAAVQRRLARGGYYHGAIDGVIGPGTRNAIRAFESNNGLPVDGVIDTQLLRTMGLS
ncbi:MAG TPA: peptidoglycan-binding domain-containing protein [Chthoniobacterales bacterium]